MVLFDVIVILIVLALAGAYVFGVIPSLKRRKQARKNRAAQ
jgi:hypothetical protein